MLLSGAGSRSREPEPVAGSRNRSRSWVKVGPAPQHWKWQWDKTWQHNYQYRIHLKRSWLPVANSVCCQFPLSPAAGQCWLAWPARPRFPPQGGCGPNTSQTQHGTASHAAGRCPLADEIYTRTKKNQITNTGNIWWRAAFKLQDPEMPRISNWPKILISGRPDLRLERFIHM